jgi:integrase
MKIRFYLADKAAKRTSLVLTIRQGTTGKNLQTLRIGTGLSIETASWNADTERVKKNYTHSSRTNRVLDDITNAVHDLYDTATRLLKTEPLAYIKAELPKRGVLERPVPPPALLQTLVSGFAAFMQDKQAAVAHSTLKTYKTTFNYLKSFEAKQRTTLEFTSIDAAFKDAFTRYLFETVGLTNNSVGKTMVILRSFMLWAKERGYTTHTIDRKLLRREFETEAATIALTDDELQRLEMLELSDMPHLDAARDLFVIGCTTGLRFSDIAALRAEHRHDGFLRIRTQKTKDPLALPITPRLQAVLAKYPTCEFPVLSHQKMNAYLKELGRLAHLDTPTEIVRYKGGERLAKTVPKYEVLTTHTARRTFITLSLQKGVQAEVVMRVSGHKDMKSFRKYIKYANEYVKDEMMKAWK